MAESKMMIDNKRTRVTRWSFKPGEETGQHIHEYDYVVVPMKDGELKIVNLDGSVSISKLTEGVSYFKEKGVNHNVINNNDFSYSFIEIEIK
jgi:quercetin dioxygenase-like cupin family protein